MVTGVWDTGDGGDVGGAGDGRDGQEAPDRGDGGWRVRRGIKTSLVNFHQWDVKYI